MHDSCTSGPHNTSAECHHQQAMSIEHQNTFFPIQLFPVWHMTCHNVLQNGRIKRECHIIHTEMQVPLSTFGTPVSSVGIEGSVTLLKKVISRSSRFHVLLITSTKWDDKHEDHNVHRLHVKQAVHLPWYDSVVFTAKRIWSTGTFPFIQDSSQYTYEQISSHTGVLHSLSMMKGN